MKGRVEAALRVFGCFRAQRLDALDSAVFAKDLFRPKARVKNDAFFLRFQDLFLCGGHLPTRLDADEMYLARSEAQCGKRDINHLVPSDSGYVGVRRSCTRFVLAHNFSRRGTRDIHGNISTTNHNDSVADREPVPEIHVQQEVNSFVDTIEVDTGN